jgi:glyoxylase-like metal-dependent hydrolase (beta-lactamase superfamily II)
VTAATSGCTVLPWYRVPDHAFARGTVVVECCVHGESPVELTYLGVGGWLIRSGESALLTAPLYSNPGLVETGLTPIAVDPGAIDRHLPDVSDVSAVLVGHGHYDHLLDVPWVLAHRAPRALLYANLTSWLQVEPFGLERRALVASGHEVRPDEGSGRVVVLSDSLAGDDRRSGRWIRVAPGIRVMPLVSDHAPHLAGVTLYSGVRERPLRGPPRSAEEWLDGRTYAFLIDLLDDEGRRRMRIYYQDAVAAPPFGLVPPEAEDSVDVALVVPATYAEVEWHPEALLEDARPDHVLLGHWEDFFRPAGDPPKPVPFTLLADFRRRLERALPEGTGHHLPLPGTRFLFR